MERLGIEYDFLPRESEILPPALLGDGAAVDGRQGRVVPGDRGQEQGLLGDDQGRSRIPLMTVRLS